MSLGTSHYICIYTYYTHNFSKMYVEVEFLGHRFQVVLFETVS